MDRKSKIYAEELLAKENFSEELLSQNSKDGTIDEREIRIAQTIYTFLNETVDLLTNAEKEETKNQIRSSVRRLGIKKQLLWWSVAAALLLASIVTSVGFYRISSTHEIAEYAQTLTNIKLVKDTRIILQNGEEVLIDKKQSQIKYDARGENIIINTDQKVVQKINDTKIVYNTVIVPYGKRTQITLAEGTRVWLNSGSRLVYPAAFAQNKREVYIEGEAVFDVVHMDDKPFIVSTKDFDVKDMGTVFNISTYSDDKYSSTVLEQGKIELIYSGNSILSRAKIDIMPGTMAIFDRNQKTFAQKQVNPKKYLSWRDGYLIFNSEKLENILRKLGRYYNMEMIITDSQLKNETFTGYLDLKNSAEEVLSIINETTSLSYSITNEKIFINPK